MKTALWKTRAGEISATEAGEGIPIVAVHGALTSGLSFEPLLERPPRGFRVLAMDMPGHGRSPASDPPPDDWPALSECLVAFLETLETEAAHLIGHSMGGGICAYTAAVHPERVQSLILMDSATQGFSLPFKGRIPLIPGIGEIVFKRIYGVSMFNRFFRDDVFFDESKMIPDRIAAYYRDFNRNRNTALCAVRTSSDPLPVQERLSQISCPTQILWGENDPLIPLSVGTKTAAQISSATLEIIPRCGHSPLEEQTEETLRIIHAFWADHTS